MNSKPTFFPLTILVWLCFFASCLFAQQPAAQLTPASPTSIGFSAIVLNPATEEPAEKEEEAEAEAEGEAEAEDAEETKEEEKKELTDEEKKKQEEEAKKKEEETKKKAEEAKRKAAEKKRKADAAKRKKARLTQFKKLQFDRRPSSILKAWSTPFSDKEEEKKEEEKAIAVTVKTNEGFVLRGLLRGKDDEHVIVDTLDGRRFIIPQDVIDDLTEEEIEEEKPELTEEQKKEAEEKEAEAKKTAEDKKEFDTSVKKFQRDVTLGEWEEVKKYLASFDEELGKATYTRLLQSMMTGPGKAPPKPGQAPPAPIPSAGRRFIEKNTFTNEDVIALADVAPYEISDTDLRNYSRIVQNSLTQGNVLEELIEGLKAYTTTDNANLTERQVAKILMQSNQVLKLDEFLPTLDEAKEKEDHEALNMLSRYYLALNDKEKKRENLEKAWEVTQAILASKEIKKKEKEEALKRAVELAPKVEEELGLKWLEESFTKSPERGMEIIASIGTATAQGLQRQPTNPTFRLKGLKLQKTAVDALLEGSPEKAEEWKDRIALLAENWLKEGENSYKYDESKTLLQDMQRDMYGNYFYDPYYYRRRSSSGGAKAITTGDLLEVRPSDKWLEFVSSGIKPKYDMLYSQLYLKVAEDELAYPYIEALAESHPEIGQDLVDEYIRVWTENHDPNSSRRRTSSYMYMYGYERKAEGIPLTRSKQERNLVELTELVKKLKELPVELDE